MYARILVPLILLAQAASAQKAVAQSSVPFTYCKKGLVEVENIQGIIRAIRQKLYHPSEKFLVVAMYSVFIFAMK